MKTLMKTLMITGALASLQPTLGFAQGIAPGWECNNGEPAQNGCRATWPDVRRPGASPPTINEQRPPQKKK
jgi:hypothetical protein